MKECDQKDGSVFNKFSIIIPCSATYFLEVGARVSLKVTAKKFFRGKRVRKFSLFKAIILKQKFKSATEKNGVPLINLALLYLVQLHIFWKWVHAFH